MSNRTTLATFALQHAADEAPHGLVDSPVTVVAHDDGPGTPATFTVERHGRVLLFPVTCEEARFDTAAEAMASALETCGWLHAVAPLEGKVRVGRS